MVCPVCQVFVREEHLYKKNIVAADNDVLIAYDAFCPHCKTEIGKMNWGVLTLHPLLAWRMKEQEKTAVLETNTMSLLRVEAPQWINLFPEESPDGEAGGAEIKTCPHCGQPLPEPVSGGEEH